MQCVLRDLRACRPLGKSKGTKDKGRREQTRAWLGWKGTELDSSVKKIA